MKLQRTPLPRAKISNTKNKKTFPEWSNDVFSKLRYNSAMK